MNQRRSWVARWQMWLAMLVLMVTTQAIATPFVTLTQTPAPTDGIQEIYVGNDLSTQVKHTIDASDWQVYPSKTRPGDFGTLLVVDGQLYAPDFNASGRGTATGTLGPRTAFVPVGQTAVQGQGTAASPLVVSTEASLPTTNLSIVQCDSFVNGDEFFTMDVLIKNAGAAAKEIIVYRALDCFLGGSDSGYGMISGTSVACSKVANNTPPDRIIQLVPLTAGSALLQASFSQVWTAIGTHTDRRFNRMRPSIAPRKRHQAG